jgi:flavin reductase
MAAHREPEELLWRQAHIAVGSQLAGSLLNPNPGVAMSGAQHGNSESRPSTSPAAPATEDGTCMQPDLRGVMRNFATGVCVATTYTDRADGRYHDAVTINSLTSLSLDPPLVSLCLRLGSAFLADLLSTKKWAISILDSQDRHVAGLLARDRATRAPTVDALPASPGLHTGALILDSASWLECVLWNSFDVGDHTLVVGEVVDVMERLNGPALVFLRGHYHALDQQSRECRTRPESPVESGFDGTLRWRSSRRRIL